MNRFIPDPSNPLWERFEKYLAEELQVTYGKLATLGMESAETEQARGKAAFIKLLLNLKTAPTQIKGPGNMEY